ncbi:MULTISPECIES: SDR family NAD(P)-dependent oxidoreductase [unclassified Bradyrhizobium]|uniref:SDR family NAD(P)-dependent oxidoreductase n=1 Tax=unclassified Bradyrhizobium TaxID=2631580 RepID=UPI002012C237|nr:MULTISPECIES: SDR family NAD(P)-dependent oxidoreductase [unclassified Bradyrhizobium]
MTRPVAIVIGMGPGLGRALVRAFAADGFAVAFVGRRADAIAAYEQGLRKQGYEVTGFAGDAGDTAAMDGVHQQIRARYGEAEVLIYNAALIEPARFVTPSAIEMARYGAADGWAAHGEPASVDYVINAFRTNVAGAHHAARTVAPAMIRRGHGTILLTGGVLAFDPWIEWGVTSMGKAALRSLGHSLAKELSGAGVHVTTVAIHGTMEAGTPYDPDLVAQAYLALQGQSRDSWSADFHFKAEEQSGVDPDAH